MTMYAVTEEELSLLENEGLNERQTAVVRDLRTPGCEILYVICVASAESSIRDWEENEGDEDEEIQRQRHTQYTLTQVDKDLLEDWLCEDLAEVMHNTFRGYYNDVLIPRFAETANTSSTTFPPGCPRNHP